MQSINKIHVNSSTKLSLNDRFTFMQTAGPKPQSAPTRRIRSRSQSASRPANNRANGKASIRNRRLLEQLDQKHKMRAALRIKRVISFYYFQLRLSIEKQPNKSTTIPISTKQSTTNPNLIMINIFS